MISSFRIVPIDCHFAMTEKEKQVENLGRRGCNIFRDLQSLVSAHVHFRHKHVLL